MLFQRASRAAFAVLRDIMERFPQELAHAFIGVFLRGDPYTVVWDQSEGSALEQSADEDQHSDSVGVPVAVLYLTGDLYLVGDLYLAGDS